ncbi:DNA ligase (NAD(+)) LigA [Mycoplasmopsis bovigenitalium]|nr:DNA ligase (NAD(+)) LigA [Mycoplasmopsis bovigenitalium]
MYNKIKFFSRSIMKEKIEQLTNLINKWNYEYFIENNPSVSDLEYDKKLKQLEELEQQYPELIHPNSPTKKVGADNIFNTKFAKFTHNKPMLSLAKAYSYDDIEKFLDNIKKVVPEDKINFSIEPKIDGLSIAIHYENGYLTKAITRGDGIEGEIVTSNIMQIESIPKIIDYKNNLEVRGEVFLPKSKFYQLNREMNELGLKKFANPRNAASGTLRQLNEEIVAKRGLEAYLYELVDPQNHDIYTQNDSLKFLARLNIPTNPLHKLVEIEDLSEEIENFAEIKNTLEYDADGLVIKLNDLNYWKAMGNTSKFPKHSIAFKYEVESVNSKITNILSSVGRTGKITYIANIEPVELNQTIVQYATLHNYDFISKMNINIGDEVSIIKAGEIIPKVINLAVKNTYSKFNKLLNCPSCNSILIENEGLVDQFCLNSNCDEKNINKIYHFASRKGMNIVGLGLSTVKDLFKAGIIKKIEDIYSLEEHKSLVLKIERFGELKFNNLMKNVEKSKQNSFDKVLFALGIQHLGQRAAKLISKQFNNFKELLECENLESIQNIENIGPKITISLIEFMKDDENRKLLLFLDEIFEYKKQKNTSNSRLNNITFVITGKLTNSRDYYTQIIENNGGIVASSVSKKTNYLLCGDDAGSKKNKAIELGTKIINEEEFMKLIN